MSYPLLIAPVVIALSATGASLPLEATCDTRALYLTDGAGRLIATDAELPQQLISGGCCGSTISSMKQSITADLYSQGIIYADLYSPDTIHADVYSNEIIEAEIYEL